jgi:GntR family transcriptional repressor for pyruvate dehydrogenase complex
MALRPLARQSLGEQVFDQLSQTIVGGEMEAGSLLPPERELAEALGVNRGAVREGLKQLAQAGLIRTRHGGGTKVLDFRRSGSFDLLSRMLFDGDGGVDLRVARSVMEMRTALAPDIARVCAIRRDDDVVEGLDAIVTRMEATDDLQELQTAALDFWDQLVRGGGNIAYELAFNTLRGTYEQVRELLAPALAKELRDHKSYRAIAQAVQRRDDVSARHVAAALVERGQQGLTAVLAALGDKAGAA